MALTKADLANTLNREVGLNKPFQGGSHGVCFRRGGFADAHSWADAARLQRVPRRRPTPVRAGGRDGGSGRGNPDGRGDRRGRRDVVPAKWLVADVVPPGLWQAQGFDKIVYASVLAQPSTHARPSCLSKHSAWVYRHPARHAADGWVYRNPKRAGACPGDPANKSMLGRGE